jgi:hypothetical protein
LSHADVFQVGGKLPFDKLRANEKTCPFALSLSKGTFAPKLKWAQSCMALGKNWWAVVDLPRAGDLPVLRNAQQIYVLV